MYNRFYLIHKRGCIVRFVWLFFILLNFKNPALGVESYNNISQADVYGGINGIQLNNDSKNNIDQESVIHKKSSPDNNIRDCSGIKVFFEKLLCEDVQLNSLDQQYNELISKVYQLLRDNQINEFKKDNSEWLDIRSKCSSKNCLTLLYSTKINNLSGYVGNLNSIRLNELKNTGQGDLINNDRNEKSINDKKSSPEKISFNSPSELVSFIEKRLPTNKICDYGTRSQAEAERKIKELESTLKHAEIKNWVCIIAGIGYGYGCNLDRSYKELPGQINFTAKESQLPEKLYVNDIIRVSGLLDEVGGILGMKSDSAGNCIYTYTRNNIYPISLSNDNITINLIKKGD